MCILVSSKVPFFWQNPCALLILSPSNVKIVSPPLLSSNPTQRFTVDEKWSWNGLIISWLSTFSFSVGVSHPICCCGNPIGVPTNTIHRQQQQQEEQQQQEQQQQQRRHSSTLERASPGGYSKPFNFLCAYWAQFRELKVMLATPGEVTSHLR